MNQFGAYNPNPKYVEYFDKDSNIGTCRSNGITSEKSGIGILIPSLLPLCFIKTLQQWFFVIIHPIYLVIGH